MVENQGDMFAAVDALLAQAVGSQLPPPAERARLRHAANLSQQQVADAVSVRRATVAGWESEKGQEPRPPHRALYARLLEGLAEKFPAPPVSSTPPLGP